MELVPVPGSGIEMTLDHHLAFNVALECVVPSIEIEKKASAKTSNNTLDHHLAFHVALECVVPSLEIAKKTSATTSNKKSFIKHTPAKQKQMADTYQNKRAARNAPAEMCLQKRACRTFEQHKQCNDE